MSKIPEIRFAGFTDDWEQLQFSEIFDIMQNNTLSRAELSDSGYGYTIHYGDVLIKYGERLDATSTSLPCITSEKILTKFKASFLQDGDIIIADTAEDETVGKCTEINNIYDKSIVSGLHTIPCRPRKQFASGYLGYYMNSDSYHNQLLPLMQGTKVTSVSKTALQGTTMRSPDTQEEQSDIATLFTRLDTLISLHQCKYEKLKLFKAAMLEKMFPKKDETVPEIRLAGFSGDWEQLQLGEMGSTYTGLSGKTKKDFGHGKGQFITYMNVFSNPITNIKMTEPIEIDSKQNEVKAGDVFFTTSSETPEEVGMSSVMLENKANTYLNSFCFGYRPSKKIDCYYIAYMLRSENIRKSISFLAQGISRYNISKNKVMEIEVPLPESMEQQKIGGFFKDLDRLITLHQRKYEKLKLFKAAMLEKMFPKGE